MTDKIHYFFSKTLKARIGSDLHKSYVTYAKAFLDHLSGEHRVRNIGAFLLEPLMLGAGCLKFIDPLYQKAFITECRSRGIPVVYDEVLFMCS